MTRTIYVNGKFAAQRVTGVQRFAIEMIRALDFLLASQTDVPTFVLLLPASATHLGLTRIEERTVDCRTPSLHVWEQAALPWAARNGLLLNLTGSAPLVHPRQIASILDTAIYDHPEAYTRAFVHWYRILFARQARHARLIVTLTEFSCQGLQRSLRPQPRVTVVGAAADRFAHILPDDAVIERLALGSRRFILSVGSANPTKNLVRLRRAFEKVADQALVLVVVGDGNAGVFVGEGAAPENSRIIAAGPVNDSELKSLYSHARGFVFPSLYEGFGLPPLEAMMCGCPVAASRTASIPEVCGSAATYFNPLDEADITAAIDRLVDDAALRDVLIAAGRHRAATFSWKTSATKLLEALDIEVTR